ncbi:MAG: DNA primase [Gammaproteobacteria bacterium]|jgi:DNA primase
MAGRIPQQFIDDLLARTDIVEVIESRVPLKRAGREYTACCPFHTEKTPSFTVSPDKQFYHCFGCGAHGSAVSFLMEYERMEFVDAIEELASRAGVSVPREGLDQQVKLRHDLYDVMEAAAKYYRQQLKYSPHSVDYLKSRGLTGQIAADFGIGYAAPGWESIIKALGDKGISAQVLHDAGLAIKKDAGGFYDRFRNRIMFPIRDRRGRVIAFGGRAVGDDTPKYLNSPENALFHKGQELYGLYEARKNVRQLERLIVVEGYMDVVSLAQFEVCNVVATLGTATTAEHLERLFRVISEVVFCFDGDRAGRKAAWRALIQALPLIREGRQVKFLFLPEGEDPDTVVRKEGADGFQSRLATALPLSEFLLEGLGTNLDLSTIDSRALLVERVKPLIRKIPGGVYQQMLLAKLAEIVHMDSEKLSTIIISNSSEKSQPQSQRQQNRPLIVAKPVAKAIRMLLEQTRLADKVDSELLAGVNLPGTTLFCSLVEDIKNNPQISSGGLVERRRGTQEGEYLAKLIAKPLNLLEEGLHREFQDTVEFLYKQRLEQRFDELTEKPFSLLSPAEKLELQQILAAKHKT